MFKTKLKKEHRLNLLESHSFPSFRILPLVEQWLSSDETKITHKITTAELKEENIYDLLCIWWSIDEMGRKNVSNYLPTNFHPFGYCVHNRWWFRRSLGRKETIRIVHEFSFSLFARNRSNLEFIRLVNIAKESLTSLHLIVTLH